MSVTLAQYLKYLNHIQSIYHGSISAQQVRYLQEQKFGGAFVWSLDLDDFAGKFCGEGNHPLLAHLLKLLDIGMLIFTCLEEVIH